MNETAVKNKPFGSAVVTDYKDAKTGSDWPCLCFARFYERSLGSDFSANIIAQKASFTNFARSFIPRRLTCSSAAVP